MSLQAILLNPSFLRRKVVTELFGGSWTKTLQYLVCEIELSFTFSIIIFSDKKTLELQAVSISFEDLFPHLTFTWLCLWSCFTCIYLWQSQILSTVWTIFSSSGWVSHSFSLCGLSHISFNFPVELFHLFMCDCHTMLFHNSLSLMLCALFLSGTTPLFFVWIHTNIHYLCVNVAKVRLDFLYVSFTQISLCLHYFYVDTPLCLPLDHNTAQKKKFLIKDFFIFCAV